MDFSLFYFAAQERQDSENIYRLLQEGAKFADKNNFSAIWVPERHFSSFGSYFPNPSVAASAVAILTKNIRIRSGSIVLPLHDPIRVAEEWSMVDNLSGGRVEISIASGWHPNDFVFFPNDYRQRRKIMQDKLKTLQNLWRGKSITRENGVGKKVEIRVFPNPVQESLPIWVTAAGSIETFQYAGSIGANLLTHLLGQTKDELGKKIEAYRQALVSSGFEKNHGKVALMLHTFVSDDEETIRSIVKEPMKNYLRHSLDLLMNTVEEAKVDEKNIEELMEISFERYFSTSGLFGSPESCIPFIESLKVLGIDEVACLIDFGIDTTTILNNLPNLGKLLNSPIN